MIVTANASDYEREMRQASSTNQTATKSWTSGFKSVALAAKAFLAIEAVRYVGMAASALIEAASAQEEALNKVNVVFGESADVILSYAEVAARSSGISKTAALSAAAGFGQMLQTAGLAQDQAATLSKSLVQLASDLSSFNDVGTDEALEKLRSGLAGEAEPLRTMGVFLSAAAVEAEAYRAGIAKVGSELTEAEKVQARYNIILQQTGLAQGDYAATMDSTANQQRSFGAVWEDLMADVGPGISKFFGMLLGYVSELIRYFPSVVGTIENAILNVGNFFIWLANAFLTWFINPVLTAMDKLVDALDWLAGPGLNFPEIETIGLIEPLEEVQHELEDTGDAGEENFELIEDTAGRAKKAIQVFADMSKKEFKDWRKSTVADIKSSMTTVAGFSRRWELTGRELGRTLDAMRRKSAIFNRDLHEIAQAKWVPDEFKQWLIEQGPDGVHAFAEVNRKEKERMVEDWRGLDQNVRKLHPTINRLEMDVRGVADALDEVPDMKDVNVRVHYSYDGFDPTKPFQKDNA